MNLGRTLGDKQQIATGLFNSKTKKQQFKSALWDLHLEDETQERWQEGHKEGETDRWMDGWMDE